MKKRILIMAGEASGDLHAAELVKNVLALHPDWKFFGMGGKHMQATGVEIIQNYQPLALVGLTEVITHLPKIYSIFKKFKKILYQEKPDLLILVDFPGFNLRLAKVAKKAKVKVFYYISPQLWAWHQSRANIIKNCVDKIAVIFPFEIAFYKKFDIDAVFVGHPLVKNVHPSLSNAEAKQFFQLAANAKTIAILPGSRKSEIKRLLSLMLNTGEILQNIFPDAQFILPLAPSLSMQDIDPYLKKSKLKIKVITQQHYAAIHQSDAAIIASGTATLEAALLKVPMALVYKSSWLNYFIGRMVIKVPFLGICNIIAGKAIVKEFIQHQATAKSIAQEIQKILTNENYRNTMKDEFEKIRQSLHGSEEKRLSDCVVDLMLPTKLS